jgi:hypothetical protein
MLISLSTPSFSQHFLTFETEKEEIIVDISTLQNKNMYTIKDKKLEIHERAFEIYMKVYFSEKLKVGMIIDPANLDYVEFNIGNMSVNPLTFAEKSLGMNPYFINISQLIENYYKQVYREQLIDWEDLNKKIVDSCKKHLRVGGEIELRIKYKGSYINYFKLVPEKYGVFLNKVTPLTVQFSIPVPDNPKLQNTATIFVPFQCICKKRGSINWNSITKNISFGLFFLVQASIDEIDNRATGIMITWSPNGHPIIGGGIGHSPYLSQRKWFWAWTINATEIIRFIS